MVLLIGKTKARITHENHHEGFVKYKSYRVDLFLKREKFKVSAKTMLSRSHSRLMRQGFFFFYFLKKILECALKWKSNEEDIR